MKIFYNSHGSTSKIEECTKEKFEAILNSKTLKERLETYRRLLDDMAQCEDAEQLKVLDERKKYQKTHNFPLMLFQAREFVDGVRNSKNALEGYYEASDFDHVKCDVKAFVDELQSRVDFKQEGIVYVERSVSGEGLHVVSLCRDGETLKEAQERMERLVGLPHDTMMEIIAQGLFLSGDVLYYDAEMMWSDEGKHTFVPSIDVKAPQLPHPTLTVSGMAVSGLSDTEKLTIGGVPYSDVVGRLMERMDEGEIVEGVRHPRLMKLAMLLRNICDYDPALLLRILPPTTPPLPQGELERICIHACKKDIDATMPKMLKVVLDELGIGKNKCGAVSNDADDEVELENEVVAMPPMPKLMKIFCNLCPPEYRPVVTMALLPVLGTLATGVKGVYNHNESQRLNFQTVIIGKQGSCKSRIIGLIRQPLLGKLEADEAEMWKKEQEFKDKLRLEAPRKRGRKSKGAEGEELSEPKTQIRVIPASNSVAQLMNRMQKAEGKHLLSIETEIGTVANSNRSGAWANKKEIYKNAFDNEVYGQDFRNADSFSAMLPVCYNLLIAGTYNAIRNFYDSNATENGLAIRVAIVFTPDGFGMKRPVLKSLSKSEEDYVGKMVEYLMSLDEHVECPKTQKAIDKWLDACKQEAIQTNSEAIDLCSRRSAVIGYRAGMLAYVLEGKKENKRVTEFAVWVAETTLRNQVKMWGDSFDENVIKSKLNQPSKHNIYSSLNDNFTRDDLRKAIGSEGNARVVISRWKKAGLIEKIGSNVYRKIAKKRGGFVG